MSELITAREYRNQLRYRLLATASSIALLSAVAPQNASADDTDHPIVWIEVGGAFDQMSSGSLQWLPPNLTQPISNPQPLPFGKLPAIGYDADLKLSFTPEDSDWVFSASVRYGRAQHGPKGSHDQSYKFHVYTSVQGGHKYYKTNYAFADTAQRSHSTHAILDFTAGKDFGLGLFGGTSTIGFGVRIAQLNENAEGQFTAFTNDAPRKYHSGEVAHVADLVASHSFSGAGPAVAWDGATPFAGSPSDGLSFDWGANAALLFGRQKADVSQRTRDAEYYKASYSATTIAQKTLSHSSKPSLRAKTVIVPNIGGFAGLSWHLPNVKVSLGYRADFFFGAIDGGLDTAQKETRGFYGPFANISIGIGG